VEERSRTRASAKSSARFSTGPDVLIGHFASLKLSMTPVTLPPADSDWPRGRAGASESVSKTTRMLVVAAFAASAASGRNLRQKSYEHRRRLIAPTGGAPKIARGQRLVVGEPRSSASLLVKFWLPEFFFLNALSVRDDLLWSKAVCAFFRYV
jgi:hypothetical protein